MATVTYTGPEATTGRCGFTFYRNEPREVPDDAARQIDGHPWFKVDGVKRRRSAANDQA